MKIAHISTFINTVTNRLKVILYEHHYKCKPKLIVFHVNYQENKIDDNVVQLTQLLQMRSNMYLYDQLHRFIASRNFHFQEYVFLVFLVNEWGSI